MSAYRIVQKFTPLTLSGAATTSGPIALKSGYLRIVPEQDAYIEVGATPTISTSTSASIFVKGGTELLLRETVISQRVVGITTGATTVIDLPEGTFSEFSPGDYIELTGISPSGINTTFASVASVDATNDAGTGGFNRKVTLTWDTSSQGGAITDSIGELRKVVKIAAYGTSGKVHITEVQIAGG
jgi:hypothetical protein